MRKEEQKLIIEFGKEMQGKLDARSKKGRLGWRKTDSDLLFVLLEEELSELFAAMNEENIEEIQKECADVANFAMFIYDNTKTK